MNNVLSLLGLAKKAGRIEIGEEPVGAACRARRARLVLLASDAAAHSARRADHFSQSGGASFVKLPFTKEELGGVLGRSSCAMVALTDAGFAASLLNKLAVADPGRYGEAARTLEVKAQKVLQRQKEQRAHEKNLARGKRKPWAAPPKTGEHRD